MRIRDILVEKGDGVVTIDAAETIHDAIVKLNEHGIGALVVSDKDDEIVGIITERDILRNCGNRCVRLKAPVTLGEKSCAFFVHEAMTKELVIGVPDDDLNYVMGVMTKNRIRHLPILDDGKLTGIISIGDLVNAHFEEKVFESRTLVAYTQGRARRHANGEV